RASRSSTSSAGVTWRGSIASKRGRPEKSSSGLDWGFVMNSGRGEVERGLLLQRGGHARGEDLGAQLVIEGGQVFGRADVRPSPGVKLAAHDSGVDPALEKRQQFE